MVVALESNAYGQAITDPPDARQDTLEAQLRGVAEPVTPYGRPDEGT